MIPGLGDRAHSIAGLWRPLQRPLGTEPSPPAVSVSAHFRSIHSLDFSGGHTKPVSLTSAPFSTKHLEIWQTSPSPLTPSHLSRPQSIPSRLPPLRTEE